MKLYEMIYVTKTDLQYDLVASLKDKIRKVIKSEEGKIVKYEDWGKRKFSYEVAGYLKGHYYLYQFAMPPKNSEKLTRIFNMDDNVLLHQTLFMKEINTETLAQMPEANDLSETLTSRDAGPSAIEKKDATDSSEIKSSSGEKSESSSKGDIDSSGFENSDEPIKGA